jgi:hypothetical protein
LADGRPGRASRWWRSSSSAFRHWQDDPDLAALRDAASFAKLPEGERQDWQKVWADVKELFAKAGGKSTRQEK